MNNNIKIGLISCYEVYNYGSQLMSLALQMMMEELGLKCEHIQYIPKKDLHFYCSIPFKLINKPLKKHKKEIKEKILIIKQDKVRQQQEILRKNYFNEFINKNLTLSRRAEGYKSLKEIAKSYQCILLGSDQVWHPMNLEGDYKNMEFVPDYIPKIVYGASFGVTDIPVYQKKRTIHYLKRISYISTREQEGADLVEKLINRKVEVVLDPTLMTKKEQWENKISKKFIPNSSYIFVYFLGNNILYRQKVKELKEKTNLIVVGIDSYNFKDINYIDVNINEAGPDDFIALIKYAKYICTDSFHGSVFSILYKKQFLTFFRYMEGSKMSANSRIKSLFSQLELNERIYKNDTDIFIEINKNIDYIKVENILEKLRMKSKNYLINALKGYKIL